MRISPQALTIFSLFLEGFYTNPLGGHAVCDSIGDALLMEMQYPVVWVFG